MKKGSLIAVIAIVIFSIVFFACKKSSSGLTAEKASSEGTEKRAGKLLHRGARGEGFQITTEDGVINGTYNSYGYPEITFPLAEFNGFISDPNTMLENGNRAGVGIRIATRRSNCKWNVGFRCGIVVQPEFPVDDIGGDDQGQNADRTYKANASVEDDIVTVSFVEDVDWEWVGREPGKAFEIATEDGTISAVYNSQGHPEITLPLAEFNQSIEDPQTRLENSSRVGVGIRIGTRKSGCKRGVGFRCGIVVLQQMPDTDIDDEDGGQNDERTYTAIASVADDIVTVSFVEDIDWNWLAKEE